MVRPSGRMVADQLLEIEYRKVAANGSSRIRNSSHTTTRW